MRANLLSTIPDSSGLESKEASTEPVRSRLQVSEHESWITYISNCAIDTQLLIHDGAAADGTLPRRHPPIRIDEVVQVEALQARRFESA
jgi:hypothetical protein